MWVADAAASSGGEEVEGVKVVRSPVGGSVTVEGIR